MIKSVKTPKLNKRQLTDVEDLAEKSVSRAFMISDDILILVFNDSFMVISASTDWDGIPELNFNPYLSIDNYLQCNLVDEADYKKYLSKQSLHNKKISEERKKADMALYNRIKNKYGL